jgi:hypothetical protein
VSLLLLFRPVNEALLGTAKSLVQRDLPGPAVVVAQTACELAVESTLTGLLRDGGSPQSVIDWVGESVQFSPANTRTRKLFEALTAQRLTGLPEWKPYDKLLPRRHAFVHRGEDVSRGDAEAFISAVESLIQAMIRVAAQARKGPGP